MKKTGIIAKTLVLALALVLCAACLAGCGTTASSEAAAAPAADSTADGTLRVAMVCNAPITDGGWNTACYNAMVEAAEKQGFETAYTENVAQTDYVTTFTNYALQGFDMVIAPGNEFTDAITEVAASNPDTSFVILNGDYKAPNVCSVTPNNKQLGYLAGCAAALQTQTNSVGFVGGLEITPAIATKAGFEEGVASINPDIKISSAYAGSYDDTAKGKEIALSMISGENVDVIFGIASAVDVGVRNAISENENCWNIAQPADLLDDAPDIIITSIVNSTSRLFELAMIDYKENTFGDKIIGGGVENGTVTLGRFGESFSQENQDKLNQIVQDLIDGTIVLE